MRHQEAARSGLVKHPSWLGNFSRITTSGRFVPEIDGLRFFAIAMVVVVHTARLATALHAGVQDMDSLGISPGWPVSMSDSVVLKLLWVGGAGVQFFFVISGFILGVPFATHHLLGESRVDLGRYFLRRVTRLEPPYLAALLLAFIVAVFVQGHSAATLAPHLLAAAPYLHGPIFGTHTPFLNVAWSLEVEVQFYLLVPLLTLLFAIRDKMHRRVALVTLIVAVGSLQLGGWLEWRVLPIAGQLQYFLVGFLLADIYLLEWRSSPRLAGHSWDALWLIGWAGVAALAKRLSLEPVVLPWLVLAIYVASFRGPWANSIVRNPWIYTIGGMCYSIYLVHYGTMLLAARLTSHLLLPKSAPLDVALQMALLVGAVVGISVLFFVLVERPCMDRRWPTKLAARTRGPRPRVTDAEV